MMTENDWLVILMLLWFALTFYVIHSVDQRVRAIEAKLGISKENRDGEGKARA